MKLVTTRSQLNALLDNLSSDQYNGLVPTMGNLHFGHLSLVKESLRQTNKTIVTIFVNPKQFGENEDFSEYPRTLESDLEKLKSLKGSENIIVFAPSSDKEIYPEGFSTTIEVTGLDQILCALHREGHFKGVTTVVYQLFKIAKANKAFFGQKDYQQYRIIEKMTHDLDLNIELEMVPIAREESGLAMSSRNQYLSEQQRKEASVIYKSLNQLKHSYLDNTQKALALKEEILFREPRWQYLELLDAVTLSEISDQTKKVLVAGAFAMGDTRLIDNIIFDL